MSDAKENEEAGQNVPLSVEETQQLVEAQVQPEDLTAPVSIVDTLNHVENGKVEVEAPVEDIIVKPEVNSEFSQEDVVNRENILHSVPLMDNTQVLNKPEGAYASDVKSKAEEVPQCDKGIGNDANVCQSNADIAQVLNKTEGEYASGVKSKAEEVPQCDMGIVTDANFCQNNADTAETAAEAKSQPCEVADSKTCNNGDSYSVHCSHNEPNTPQAVPADIKPEIKTGFEIENKDNEKQATVAHADNGNSISKNLYFLDPDYSYDGNESGTEEEQSAFMKELENFFRERSMEFKPPKFYKEGLNCLKTCTTVSWTFRVFYEKALLDYERHKTKGGELNVPITSHSEPMNIENQGSASGRARRDAAARAMQGWHSQRLLGNGEVSDPIIKDRNSLSTQKREKQLKSINLLKRKKPSDMVNAVKVAHSKPSKPQLRHILDMSVVDIGPPADWVKINVQKTKDCFEVYALVPGLLREEVRVQSDPAGRLVISGEPEHSDNPWGVTPFKKVVSLPSRIDTQQTSAVVTLHGQLFVRVPFEQSE
ncbi:AT-rich interactive domain-containing protein 3, partial [Mucuna pruriens]